MARKIKLILTDTDTGRSTDYTFDVNEVNNRYLKDGDNLVTHALMAMNEQLNDEVGKKEHIVLPNTKVC